MDSNVNQIGQASSHVTRNNNKEHHIHTMFLPYEKSIEAVPYYTRKKRQLKSKNYALQHNDDLDRRSSKLSVDLSVSNEFRTKKKSKHMINEITVEPVFNENKFTSFDPQLYPLEQSQKVKVVEQRYFPLQNYYNYIWAVKTSEDVFRIAQQTQKKAQQALFNFVGQLIDGDYDQTHKKQPVVNQTMKIKGIHESRFNPYKSVKKNTSNEAHDTKKILAPMHVQFKQDYNKNNPFYLKQGKRLTIVKQHKKQQTNKYRT